MPAALPDYTIAAVGDIACSPTDPGFAGGEGKGLTCRHRAVAEAVRRIAPKKLLTLGDLQYEQGKLVNFQRVYDKSWGAFKAITVPAPGNHEYETPGAAGYRAYYGFPATGPLWRSVNTPNGWHLVSLDSNASMSASSPQLAWFRRDLAAHDRKPTVVFWHHPRWSSGRHGESGHVAPVWNACISDPDCQLVLNGHEHGYERFAPMGVSGPAADGVRQITVGTGGKNLRPFRGVSPGSEVRSDQALGALSVTLGPTSYRWRFVSAVGELTESGSQTLRRR